MTEGGVTSTVMAETFFTVRIGEGREWFVGSDHARGPWDERACHAGPPTALMARASERVVPDQRLTRLTVELHRPVPMAGFRIEAEVVRAGRTTSTTSLTIIDTAGKACVSARGLHVAVGDVLPATVGDVFAAVTLEQSVRGDFPLNRFRHAAPCFTDGVEVRYPPGETRDPGPTTMWMRTVELLPDEAMSPFQRICPLADCGNAVGRNAEPTEVGFVNADLSIALHRDPIGEWMGISASSVWQPTGIGLSDSVLFDELGAVGRALQTLVLTPILR